MSVDLGDDAHVIVSGGDRYLGGKDWDDALLNLMDSQFQDETALSLFDDSDQMAHFRQIAENLKRRLSRAERGRALVHSQGESVEISIDRASFEDATRELVHRTLDITEDQLRDAGLAAKDLDEILLVGGSTRMPVIRSRLQERFNLTPHSKVNADEAVALGSAILAADHLTPAARDTTPSGIVARPQIQEVTTHSLGMIAVNAERTAFENTIILKRNAPIPAANSRPYRHLFRTADDALEIFVTEGETSSVTETTYVGRYEIRNLPGVAFNKPCKVQIRYALSLIHI